VLVAAACSPAQVAADGDTNDSGGFSADGGGGTDGSGGSDGSGAEDGAGGSTSGGSGGEPASGGSAGDSGGTSSSGGGSDGGTGGIDSACDQGEACVAAANFDDQCFSPGCSGPVAATAAEVEENPCLVPWEDREDAIPEQCAAHDSVVICPAICEVAPPCVGATCSELTGECTIEVCVP